MPTLVHLTDAKLSGKISKSGIKPGSPTRVVYFMPVLRDHFVSHQWLRELRRGGAREITGVYFRLPREELVWAGRYNQPHRQLPLGEAIGELMRLLDPLGCELFLGRKIHPREISRLRSLPQKIGWRYMPRAHGRPLCGCPACIPRGTIRSRALRARLEPSDPVPSYRSLVDTLNSSRNEDDILDSSWALRDKRRRADPMFLQPLLSVASATVLEELAVTLSYFRHRNSRVLLVKLLESGNSEVKEAAGLSICELGGAYSGSHSRPL